MSRSRLWGARAVGATLLAASAMALAGLPAFSEPAAGSVRHAGGDDAVPNSFIVKLKDNAVVQARGVSAVAGELAAKYQGTVGLTYSAALRGFAVTMGEEQARKLSTDENVDFVEQNKTVRVSGTQPNPPSWGLDRIDQRDLPLNTSYSYPNTAANVNAYVIDTGVRISHSDFGGRAVSGFDFIDNDANADDCHGHGTHVAGTVGGTAHGVAKAAKLVAVRVLNCQGSGTWAQVIGGVDWVTANAVKPAVANMSLGGGANDALDTAIRNSINSGVTYAIAAGNGDIFGNPLNACTQSPARVPEAITVGATDKTDTRATWSNIGTCLDLFGPGVDITSAWKDSDSATRTISGTSMATPHVAGVAALILSTNPGFSPTQVRDTMVNASTPGKVLNPGANSPNQLLFVAADTTPPPTCNTFSNDADVAIPDLGKGESPITVVNCTGLASSVTVEVKIKHTYRGDLVIDLLAPDGTPYRLKNSNSGDSVDDVNATYTAYPSGKAKAGKWTLRVQDVARADTGTIDSWSIKL